MFSLWRKKKRIVISIELSGERVITPGDRQYKIYIYFFLLPPSFKRWIKNWWILSTRRRMKLLIDGINFVPLIDCSTSSPWFHLMDAPARSRRLPITCWWWRQPAERPFIRNVDTNCRCASSPSTSLTRSKCWKTWSIWMETRPCDSGMMCTEADLIN